MNIMRNGIYVYVFALFFVYFSYNRDEAFEMFEVSISTFNHISLQFLSRDDGYNIIYILKLVTSFISLVIYTMK